MNSLLYIMATHVNEGGSRWYISYSNLTMSIFKGFIFVDVLTFLYKQTDQWLSLLII
jgi:hypothetical protein